MTRRAWLRTGLWGAGITAICCFTPLLVWILAGVGLSAAIVWLDWVLFPLLALFLGMAAAAWFMGRRA